MMYSGANNVQAGLDHFKQALAMDPDCTEAAKLFKAARKFEVWAYHA